MQLTQLVLILICFGRILSHWRFIVLRAVILRESRLGQAKLDTSLLLVVALVVKFEAKASSYATISVLRLL